MKIRIELIDDKGNVKMWNESEDRDALLAMVYDIHACMVAREHLDRLITK